MHAADPDHPLFAHLADAGVAVCQLAPAPADVLAAELHRRAEEGQRVVWLARGGADEELARAVGMLAARGAGVEVEILHGSYDPPGARLLDVVAVMDRLRGPAGCPWDAEQTHTSLAPYLLEEAYEAYAAIEEGDRTGLREELGDVLLQVAFHARLAQELPEGERWDVDDVATDLVAKLVRRHPHVFAGAAAADSAAVQASWEELKAAEKGRTSVTDGVPLGQPALALSAKLQRRGERLGVPAGLFAPRGPAAQLWEAVAALREAGVDPEAALRQVARDFRDRVAAVEAAARADGLDPAALTEAQWRARWAPAHEAGPVGADQGHSAP